MAELIGLLSLDAGDVTRSMRALHTLRRLLTTGLRRVHVSRFALG